MAVLAHDSPKSCSKSPLEEQKPDVCGKRGVCVAGLGRGGSQREVVSHRRAYWADVADQQQAAGARWRGGRRKAYQMKSVQWLQKVGCLKNRAVNLWFFTSWTFFCLRAPFRANLLATSAVDESFELTSAMSSPREQSDAAASVQLCGSVWWCGGDVVVVVVVVLSSPSRDAAFGVEPAECGASLFTGDTVVTV